MAPAVTECLTYRELKRQFNHLRNCHLRNCPLLWSLRQTDTFNLLEQFFCSLTEITSQNSWLSSEPTILALRPNYDNN